ncbi:hypothetical protein GCM10007858_48490 [Bradyrhizobium liaoningense]|uniref:hypothetical protein n=1 Tax=Bradyrhizobium liaoningense TaxID=43992 RepID=UPI00235C5E10|nr:hypothetical protein [Bradyrhizobium liaoningense]GLR97209.1 hypothetical protein GCM10007858_48490 [Bradyrhizobium liaoningense]
MQFDLLASAKLKIEGADGHIKNMDAQIRSFFDAAPCPIRSYIDVEDGYQWIKVELLRRLPGPIGLSPANSSKNG